MKKLTNRKTLSLLILTTLIITSLSTMTPKVFAAGRIYMNPPKIDNPALGPGSTFIVNATAQNVVNVFTWQVQAEFNPSILNCLSVLIPASSPFGPPNFPISPPPIIDNTNGIAVYGASMVGTGGYNGSGILMSIQFQVVGRGYSHINYSKPYGMDTFLVDQWGITISVTVEDGSFNNGVPSLPAKIYINPPKVVDPTLIAGSTFNISLNIINASNLHSWSANLLYANTVLMATNVIEGSFLKSAGSTTFSFTIQHNYNLTHGRIQMSCALATGGANGNGELAKITFQVLDLGQSAITITNVDLRDPSGISLPFTTADGYFNNILLAKLSIDPSEVSGPEYLPGTTFWINVTLDNVENLKTCIFNLTYDSSVIMEINVFIPSVLGQTPVKKLIIDDEAGFIWAKLTYPNPITTYNPVTITKVEFQVMAMGVSYINLTDTALLDAAGQPITHEVHNGIFIGLIRDVAVISIITDLSIAYQGWLVNVNVTVKNKGNVTETFQVKMYYEGNLGGTGTVTDLPPNEETTIIIVWNTTGVPCCHNYTISATAGPVPYEFNLSDNTLTDGKVKIRVMGDANGDGVVDMRDIGIVCNAYGSNSKKPNWNPYLDFNRDKRVDLRDIGICCNNYLKHC